MVVLVWNGFELFGVVGLKGLVVDEGGIVVNGFGFFDVERLNWFLLLIFNFKGFKFWFIGMLELLNVIYEWEVDDVWIMFEFDCSIDLLLLDLLNCIYDLFVSKFNLVEVNDMGGIIEVVWFEFFLFNFFFICKMVEVDVCFVLLIVKLFFWRLFLIGCFVVFKL